MYVIWHLNGCNLNLWLDPKSKFSLLNIVLNTENFAHDYQTKTTFLSCCYPIWIQQIKNGNCENTVFASITCLNVSKLENISIKNILITSEELIWVSKLACM